MGDASVRPSARRSRPRHTRAHDDSSSRMRLVHRVESPVGRPGPRPPRGPPDAPARRRREHRGCRRAGVRVRAARRCDARLGVGSRSRRRRRPFTPPPGAGAAAKSRGLPGKIGGPEGTRTPDPLHAMQVRYQLRHRPGRCSRSRGATRLAYNTPGSAPYQPQSSAEAAAGRFTGTTGQSFQRRSSP